MDYIKVFLMIIGVFGVLHASPMQEDKTAAELLEAIEERIQLRGNEEMKDESRSVASDCNNSRPNGILDDREKKIIDMVLRIEAIAQSMPPADQDLFYDLLDIGCAEDGDDAYDFEGKRGVDLDKRGCSVNCRRGSCSCESGSCKCKGLWGTPDCRCH